MLGEHFPLVVIGCAEALLAVVLLCAALRKRRQCTEKKRSALRRADEILLYNMDRQSNDVCLIMRQHDLLPICVAGDMQSLLGVTFEQLRQDVMLLADALEDGQKGVSIWKKYRAWDGAQPFETVLRTKNGEWLQTQGFDPFTQSAAYYRLTGDAPKANTVEVSVQNASRDAVYAPASMEKVTDGDVHERRDALLKGRGLFGTRNYTVTEVSGTRPSELMVAENWVSSPQTEEQTAYAEAESVYRSFVYDAYTAADEDLLPVLNRLFWQDYDDENDGVYSALSRIREVLKAQVRYSETAEAAPDNADPIAYFLTDLRKGNAVLYASATVQALRAHGIPARYAEGYYLPIAKTQGSADGTAALTGQDAHAWAEVYFDGIGWLPVDATPGYYFDAVALQQMVSLPDTVRKTAAIDEDWLGAEQVVEPSGTVILLFTLLRCAMELTRTFLLWYAERKRRRMSIEECVRQSQKLMFKLISLWEIDAALGWETSATYKALADTLPSVKPGEYERVNGLLEKTIYGGIALEPFEERALDLFVQRLWGRNVKKSWKMRLKLRYAYLLAAK